jgi:hypothetical protein
MSTSQLDASTNAYPAQLPKLSREMQAKSKPPVIEYASLYIASDPYATMRNQVEIESSGLQRDYVSRRSKAKSRTR